MTASTMLPNIHPLPRAEHHAAVGHRYGKLHIRQSTSHMRRHVVRPFADVLEHRIAVGHQPCEESLKVAADIGIGILLDQQAGGCAPRLWRRMYSRLLRLQSRTRSGVPRSTGRFRPAAGGFGSGSRLEGSLSIRLIAGVRPAARGPSRDVGTECPQLACNSSDAPFTCQTDCGLGPASTRRGPAEVTTWLSSRPSSRWPPIGRTLVYWSPATRRRAWSSRPSSRHSC